MTKANGNQTAENQTAKTPNVEIKKEKSAYGTAVEIMCKTPDMKKEDLVKKLKAQGIDTEKSKNAIMTGYSQTRKIVSELRKHKHMK